MCFLACQKAPVLEHRSGFEAFAGPKHIPNLHDIVFILSFLSSKTNWVQKHLSQSDPKCKDCFLTRWRLITCILLIVERNSSNQFKRNYPKNQRQYLIFLLHFWNLHEILHILKKRITLMAEIFSILLTPKNVFPWMPKSSSFRTLFGIHSIYGSQALSKSTRHRFYPDFPLLQDKLSWKTSLLIRSKM